MNFQDWLHAFRSKQQLDSSTPAVSTTSQNSRSLKKRRKQRRQSAGMETLEVRLVQSSANPMAPPAETKEVFQAGVSYDENRDPLKGGVSKTEDGSVHQDYDNTMSDIVGVVDGILGLLPNDSNNEGHNPNKPQRRIGNSRSQRFVTGNKDDTVRAAGGNDEAMTGKGADHVDMGSGHDRAFTGKGHDTALGGSGNDELNTGKGRDLLDGEEGNDVLNGGLDHDRYRFKGNWDHDVIVDSSTSGEIAIPEHKLEDISVRGDGSDLELRITDSEGTVEKSVLFRDFFAHSDRSGWVLKAENGFVRLDTRARGDITEMAILSQNSYDDAARLNPPVGYQVHTVMDDAGSGLDAVMYSQTGVQSHSVTTTNHLTGETEILQTTEFTPRNSSAVLSIRGTEVLSTKDWIADIQWGRPQAQVLKGNVEFFLRTNSVDRIVIEGHSLGYLDAQWVAAELATEFPDVDFQVIGFNGPGAAHAIPQMQHALPANVTLTNVVHEQDFVWQLGAHHEETIFHVIPEQADVPGPVEPTNPHLMEGIIDYLNTHNGQLPAAASAEELRETAAKAPQLLDADERADLVNRTKTKTIYQLSVSETVYEFDMGATDSNVEAGHTQVSPETTYSADRGYGWESEVDSGDRGRANDLERDFVKGSQMDFRADVDNGSYDVTVTVGDRDNLHQAMQVQLQGYVQETITTYPGQFLRRTFRVNVVDGHIGLSLTDIGGTNANAVLNGVEISRVDPLAPPVDNTQIAQNPAIVVLTHGWTGWDWMEDLPRYIGVIDEVYGVVKDTASFVTNINNRNIIGAAESAIDIYEGVVEIKNQLEDGPTSRVADWVFQTAREMSRMVRRQGLGILDPNVVPIELSDVEKASKDNVLKKWTGSQDFLAIDWTDESNDGTHLGDLFGISDFNEREHRAAVERASRAIVKMVNARIRAELEKNPDMKLDILFVGHSFGGSVTRDAVARLNESDLVGHIDYAKVMLLDPVAMKPDSDASERAETHDRFYWYHPEFTGFVDAARNYYQTEGLAPFNTLESQLIGFKPLDGKAGGGALGFTNRQARVWDVLSGEESLRFRHLKEDTGRITSGQIRDIMYSGDGKWIVSVGADAQIKIRSAVTGDEWLSLDSHLGTVRDVAMIGDEYVVTVGSKKDRTVQITRLSDATVIAAGLHKGATDVAISEDGKWFATAGKGKSVKVWQLVEEDSQITLRHEATLTGNNKRINTLAFDPITQSLVTGGGDSELRIYARNGDQFEYASTVDVGSKVRNMLFHGESLLIAAGSEVGVWNRIAGSYVQSDSVLKDHVDDVHALAISADGKRLATGGDDKTIFVYDLESLAKINTLNSAQLPIRNLGFSPDGNSLAAAYFDHKGGPVTDLNVTRQINDEMSFWRKLSPDADTKRHNMVPTIYIDNYLRKQGENFFWRRDNPRVSRPGEFETSHTRRRDNSQDDTGTLDPIASNAHPVEVVDAPEDVAINRPLEIAMSDVFRDQDGTPLQYSVQSSNGDDIAVRLVDLGSGDLLIVTPIRAGITTITLSATDGVSTQTVTFSVEAKDQDSIAKLDELKERARKLKDDTDARRKELADAKGDFLKAAKLAKDARKLYEKFPDKADKIDAKIAKLASAMTQQEEQQAWHEAKQADFRREIAPKTNRISELEQERDRLNDRINEVEGRLKEINNRVKQLNRQLKNTRGDRRAELKAEKRELKTEKKELKQDRKQLRKERKTDNTERKRLEKQTRKTSKRIDNQQRKIDRLQKKIDKKELKLSDLQQKLDGLTGPLQEARDKLARAVALRDSARELYEATPAFEQESEDAIGRVLAEIHDLREKKLVNRIGLQKFELGLARNAKRSIYLLAKKMDMPQGRLDKADSAIDQARKSALRIGLDGADWSTPLPVIAD